MTTDFQSTDNTDNSMKQIPDEIFTYKIIGSSYNVYNRLGYGYQEKYYQRAFEKELDNLKIPYQKEKLIKIKYQNGVIGRYFIDFEIDGRLIVELKVANEFYQKHINQVLAYLKSSNIKLGLLILFTKTGIKIKRLIV